MGQGLDQTHDPLINNPSQYQLCYGVRCFFKAGDMKMFPITLESTVKPVIRRHLKIDKKKVFMENGSLMKVEGICRMIPLEHSAILMTCIKR